MKEKSTIIIESNIGFHYSSPCNLLNFIFKDFVFIALLQIFSGSSALNSHAVAFSFLLLELDYSLHHCSNSVELLSDLHSTSQEITTELPVNQNFRWFNFSHVSKGRSLLYYNGIIFLLICGSCVHTCIDQLCRFIFV